MSIVAGHDRTKIVHWDDIPPAPSTRNYLPESKRNELVIASLLIITFLAGIGFQLRRWVGKQPWYIGIGFVILLYVPAFIGAVGGLSAFGTPIDAALTEAPGPVFGGLLLGAFCLCSSGALLPGAAEEILRTEEADGLKKNGC